CPTAAGAAVPTGDPSGSPSSRCRSRSSAPRWARGRGVRGEPVVASGLVAVASCGCVLLLVPSPRTHAAPGREAAGRAGVTKAGTVVLQAPEPGRLKGGDRCVLQSRCKSPVRVARGETL